jgi:hypothetical protein
MNLAHLFTLATTALLTVPNLAHEVRNKDHKEEVGKCTIGDKYCDDQPGPGTSFVKACRLCDTQMSDTRCLVGQHVWYVTGATCPLGYAKDGTAKCNEDEGDDGYW